MSAAEWSDPDVDAQLAAGFCRELDLRIGGMASALAAWQAARDAREAARAAVEPAEKRAWAAQLQQAATAEELTRRLEAARDEADRARRELVAAKQGVREAVEAAESDVRRMQNMTLHGDAAGRLDRMAFVTTERARITRDEAGLGPSPEDVERRQCAERGAADLAAATAERAADPTAATVAEPVSAAVTPAVELTREAHVLGLLAQEPTIAAAELARRVGVNRRTLYRWPKVKAALQVRRAGRRARQVRGRSLEQATSDDDESPRLARSSRERPRSRDR